MVTRGHWNRGEGEPGAEPATVCRYRRKCSQDTQDAQDTQDFLWDTNDGGDTGLHGLRRRLLPFGVMATMKFPADQPANC